MHSAVCKRRAECRNIGARSETERKRKTCDIEVRIRENDYIEDIRMKEINLNERKKQKR
jgi:hypothetical protein